MQTKIIKGIENVDYMLWKDVTAGHPFAGWNWCLYGERAIGAPGYYVVVCEDGVPLGGACYYVLHTDALPIQNALVHRTVKWYLQRFPMIVARTAYGTNFKGVFLPDEPEKRGAVLQQLLEAGKQITREHRGSFLICDYLEDSDLEFDWPGCLVLRDFLDVGTFIDTGDYEDFDAYMQDLRQKKGKRPPKEIRRNSRKAKENGIRVEFAKDVADPDRILQLISTIDDKYDEVFDRPYTTEMMEGLTTLDETQAFWMTAFVEDDLISCELILFDPDTGVCTPTLFGRDQSVDYSYFYTFYEVIRYSIEDLKAARLIGGSGKEHFKLRLAYEPDHRNHFAVYIPSPVNRLIARGLIHVLSNQELEATAGPSAKNNDEDNAFN